MTQAYNLSQLGNKVNSSGKLDVSTGTTGVLATVNGGSGQSTYTDGQLLIGNTSTTSLSKSTLTAGAGISITNGSGTITIANTGTAQFQSQLFTAPGTWTCPATTTQVRVTVIGGGGGGGSTGSPAGTTGGTSSFGPAVSATGGVGVPAAPASNNGANGTATVSVGTTLRNLAIAPSSLFTTTSTVVLSQGVITGTHFRTAGTIPAPQQTGTPYTTTSAYFAGVGGGGTPFSGGFGGMAIAIVPVSNPVAITVGGGGPGASSTSGGGVGGAILVEWAG